MAESSSFEQLFVSRKISLKAHIMSATPEANFDGDSGDEYEENVRRQRAENAALLASLDLQSGGSSIVDPKAARTRKLDAAAEERKRKRAAESRAKANEERKKRKAAEEVARPARTSARLAGRTPAGVEEENKRIEEEREALERKREEARKVLHSNHDLKALLSSGATADADDDANREKAEKLEAALRVILANEDEDGKPKKPFQNGSGGHLDGVKSGTRTSDRDVKDLQKELDKMQLLAVKKVTPKRIYTAAFHPSADKDIIFTGDKEGHVSVWEPFAARQTSAEDDDEEDDEAGAVTGDDGVSWNLRLPHDSSPISCLKVPLLDPSSLFFSSYNSTLRKVDLEKSVSEEVFSFASGQDDSDDGALLSVFDFQGGAEDGKVVWCGDHRGGVIRIDLREPAATDSTSSSRGSGSAKKGPTNWKRWQLCEKKVSKRAR